MLFSAKFLKAMFYLKAILRLFISFLRLCYFSANPKQEDGGSGLAQHRVNDSLIERMGFGFWYRRQIHKIWFL